jgi:hypothetical protein
LRSFIGVGSRKDLALNKTDVVMCLGLVLYDERGRALRVTRDDDQVCLYSNDGAIQLKCACNDHDITDVVDPAGNVSLVVNLVGDPSVGSSRIVNGGFVLGLRWLQA